MAWVPEGGKSRRFRNTGRPVRVAGKVIPRGGTISRRAHDNLRAQRAGFRNRYELEQTRISLSGSQWLQDIYLHTGRPPTFRDYADIAAVKARRRELQAEHGDEYRRNRQQIEAEDDFLSDPDGPLARILDHSGRRVGYGGRPVGGS